VGSDIIGLGLAPLLAARALLMLFCLWTWLLNLRRTSFDQFDTFGKDDESYIHKLCQRSLLIWYAKIHAAIN
jgi:hypothetical protein